MNYDVIIVGAGSIGVPLSLSLAESGKKVLVLEATSSPGQGNNKKAIGGIRATHSDYGKIKVSLRSIEIFSTWKEKYGTNIGWVEHGYSFPAYDQKIENMLKDNLKVQKQFGLNIDWISPEEYQKLVPGINMNNLRGATYSPKDGSASNLLTINTMFFRAKKLGVEFKFLEEVMDIRKDSTFVVKTKESLYKSEFVVNAAGSGAKKIAGMIGIDLPVKSDLHEAAITEPVKRFMGPMVVDLRNAPGSKNFYFYQNSEGQVVFCLTPDPQIFDDNEESTSLFFTQISKRMIDLYPKLANLKVRRSWRGRYPMTPDGFPIVGEEDSVPNFVNVAGMCGQGFMLGPGLGEIVTKIINKSLTDDDKKILKSFDPKRDFTVVEAFK